MDEDKETDNKAVLLHTRTGRGGAKSEQHLKLMPHPILNTSLKVGDVTCCYYLSFVADQLWISDGSNLVLADTKGAISFHLKDISQQSYQVHTMANDGTLFYIAEDFHINKLSNDQQGNTLISLEESWEPLSVFCSPSSGDILVGTHISHDRDKSKSKGKITRYNSDGQPPQTIQYDNNGEMLYRFPGYLSENRNGDIIVSDWRRVVVTDRDGTLRFTYTGHSGPRISPRGNCTDTLSNILVCDMKTKSVHIIDKDGHFLSYLLRNEKNMIEPHSLSYDEKNNLLWIGSYCSNTLCVYKYIDKQE